MHPKSELYPLARLVAAGISLEDDHPPIDVDASGRVVADAALAAAGGDQQRAAGILRGVLRELVARARLRRAVRASGVRS